MPTHVRNNDHLIQIRDDRRWVVAAPTSLRQYPRTPYQAVQHAVEYISGVNGYELPWNGRGMAAVARCFGLQSAATEQIPASVPGPKYAAIRQYRWLLQTYPELVVPAPSPYTFGGDVPFGSILYWDDTDGGGGVFRGSVGIGVGYRNGILQQLCATSEPTKNFEVRDFVPRGCLGWTVPVFFAESSIQSWSLWEGDTHPDLVNFTGMFNENIDFNEEEDFDG